MSLQVKCNQIGGSCDYLATGTTPSDVVISMFKHAALDHAPMLQTLDEQGRTKLEQKILSSLEG